MSTCHLCDVRFPSVAYLVHHLQLIHPELWDSIERWPDGKIVWHDDSVTVGDITGGAA